MWSSGRRALQDRCSTSRLLSGASPSALLRCPYQKKAVRPGFTSRHRIYKLVEDTKQAPKQKMELILTAAVPKLGVRGDTVFVRKSAGRNKLLPQGLAVYPSPENKHMFEEEIKLLREGKPEERVQTRSGQLLGVFVPPHALSLPFESVKEEGDYWCEVTVNGMDIVRVPLSVEAAVKLVSDAPVEEAAVKLVSDAPVEEAAVKLVSDAPVEEAAVKLVSDAPVEEAAVKLVSDAPVEEAAVKLVSDAPVEEAAVKLVSDAPVEEAAVKLVSDATVEEAAVKLVSDAPVEEAAVEAETAKDSVAEASEAAAGVSAAEEEKAASTPTSPDTTAPPSDSPKKD
ncbi:hypothetical protein F7725_025195 [Dissostichus mawsoni]|uniref:Large ribosomal subunit protein bL9m n=1 Tax=Dissostichus mawsoni TaxID=36200 RepID=A0A7J5XAN8_DISMA|nr:hypothetical protein F7725_025195 [Dissostichus mawsoni]